MNDEEFNPDINEGAADGIILVKRINAASVVAKTYRSSNEQNRVKRMKYR